MTWISIKDELPIRKPAHGYSYEILVWLDDINRPCMSVYNFYKKCFEPAYDDGHVLESVTHFCHIVHPKFGLYLGQRVLIPKGNAWKGIFAQITSFNRGLIWVDEYAEGLLINEILPFNAQK